MAIPHEYNKLLFANLSRMWMNYIRGFVKRELWRQFWKLDNYTKPHVLKETLFSFATSAHSFSIKSEAEQAGPVCFVRVLLLAAGQSKIVTWPKGRVSKGDDGFHRQSHMTMALTPALRCPVDHVWYFILEKRLRLNISFEHVSFLLGSDLRKCFIGNVSVISSSQTAGSEADLYCGINSGFPSFPTFPDAAVHLKAESYVAHHMLLSFSVIDLNLVRNTFMPTFAPNLFYHLTLAFQLTGIHHFVKMYHFAASKTQIIVLVVEKGRNVVVHDGPGRLSSKLKPEVYKKNSQLVSYTSSSFQCVFVCLDKHINDTFNYSFSGGSFPQKSLLVNQFTKLAFPLPFCSVTKVCTLHLETNATSINVHVTMFLYSGDKDNTLCSYAGLAMYDQVTMSEMFTYCFSSVPNYQHRPFNSKHKSAFLILYQHCEYGNMSLTMLLSSTHCTSVSLNMCQFKSFCLLRWTDNCLAQHFEISAAPNFKVLDTYYEAKPDLHRAFSFRLAENTCTILQIHLGLSSADTFEDIRDIVSKGRCTIDLGNIYSTENKERNNFYSITGYLHGKFSLTNFCCLLARNV